MSSRLIGCVTLAVLLVVLVAGDITAGAVGLNADEVLQQIGSQRGVCAVLNDAGCELAIGLAAKSELTIYVQLDTEGDVAAARAKLEEAGLLNSRVYVERGRLSQIHLADNICDAVIALAPLSPEAKAEAMRILRPGGKVIIGGEQLTKAEPEGADVWSHHYYGPDNNPQSRDTLARAPFLTQFMAEPRYMAAPQATVAAGGRIFAAAGHIAWHKREEKTLNQLIAINAYNGTVLWTRPLSEGVIVDRSTMIATNDTLYLADDKSCKLIDAATGEVRDEIAPAAEQVGGTFWKWMGMDDGMLFALIGKAEPKDPTKRWRSESRGWPWDGISDGYNKDSLEWGKGGTLVGIDPKSKRVIWTHTEQTPIDARALCMKDGRIYIFSYGNYLAALDAKNGKELWRKTPATDPQLFEAIGKWRPGGAWGRGWKTIAYLKCSSKALYFAGAQLTKLTAVAAEDGELLWSKPTKNQHLIIRDEGLYTIGLGNWEKSRSFKLDPLTGEELAEYVVGRRGCTRATGGPDGIFFRGFSGSVRLDVATGKSQFISPMRPSCQSGVIIAHGLLYWLPWACDCNLQMFGVIGAGPAGDFPFGQKATAQERLTKGDEDANVAQLKLHAKDWCTYRHDNSLSSIMWASVPKQVKLLWEFTPKAPVETTAPTAAGGMVFTGGTDGVVRAFDAATGKLRWRAYTGGAILFPPTVVDGRMHKWSDKGYAEVEGRVFVGSADGYAYAFEATTGRLLWKFRAAPKDRKIPFYGKLSSTWPVASGVLAEDGTVYFAAGINNYDGTYVYALDAASGEIKWENNTSGRLDEFSRRGVSVQGAMLAYNGMLYLPGGNAVSPGVYDMATGKCVNAAPVGNNSNAPVGRELRLSLYGFAARRGQVLKTRIVTVQGQPLYSTQESPRYGGFRPAPRGVPMVVTRNARITWEQLGTKDEPTWRIVARNSDETSELWSHSLPAKPLRWGIAVDAAGRIAVTLRDGRVLCFGKK